MRPTRLLSAGCAALALLLGWAAPSAFAEASAVAEAMADEPADKPAYTHSLRNGDFEQISDGFPTGWSAYAPDFGPETKAEIGPSSDAHSGRWSLRLAVTGAAHPTEMAGVNRAYPRDVWPAGRVEARRGGFTFWYKFVRREGGRASVQVIAMGSEDIEDTGSPRITFDLPPEHAGDGLWHEAFLKFDFTDNDKVAWIQPVLRIFDGPAEFLADDIAYVESLGPRLAIKELTIEELHLAKEAAHLGQAGLLRVVVTNGGDAPAQGVTVTVALPEGLTAEAGPWPEEEDSTPEEAPPVPERLGERTSSVAIPRLEPDGKTTAEFLILGRRDKPGEIGVTATSAGLSPSSRILKIAPRLEIVGFRGHPSIMEYPGGGELFLVLENHGTGLATELKIEVKAPKDITLDLEYDTIPVPREIAPGDTEFISWRVTAHRQSPRLGLQVRVTGAHGVKAWKATSIIVAGKIPDEAHLTQRAAVIQSGNLRIVFPASDFDDAGPQYGVGMIQLAPSRTNWHTIGATPALARVVYLTADGKRIQRAIYAKRFTFRREGGRDRLRFESRSVDEEGARWQVSVEFLSSGRPVQERISVHSELACDRPRKVLAFEGPMIYWGEGKRFGIYRDDAILPGLEWLVSGEKSSSTLDDTSPAHLRYVPHPNKVTVPCATQSFDGWYSGIEWDLHQKWDGVHDRPSVVFASPNWIEDTASDLMGLFVPSVPDWVEENKRQASKPYLLEPRKTLSLSMSIFAGQGDALDGQVAWYEEHGLSEPLPMPRGDAQREIAFSMAAYTDSLYIPEEETWWTSKGGGPLLSHKGLPAPFVDDLWLASIAVKDPALKRKYRDFARRMLDRLSLSGAGYPLAFRVGGLRNAMAGLAGQVQSLIAAQREDGSWRFDADRKDTAGVFKGYDYHELGPDDAAEVGTCAWNAYYVLRFARMTGDEKARAAGLKALEFMDRFKVPRAAQVWEVPVHTPDVLAASDAVEAYLEGYQITGEQRYLDRAVYWAKAGLPFIYMWNAPEFKFMRYASIPVFGASQLKYSWLGRPVQWNGLRYGYALQKLARFDQSMDWPRLAHGLMVSGMYQQAEEGENKALWPDSIGAIEADKSAWVFAPYQINKILYSEMGLDPEPQTTVLDLGGGRARVSSVARIASARVVRLRSPQAEGSRIEAALEYPAGETSHLLVCGVTEPSGVAVNGRALPRADSLEASSGAARHTDGGQAWWYDAARAMLIVRVAHAGSDRLVIDGIEATESRFLPEIAERIAFDFDRAGDTEGWYGAHHIAAMTAADGVLRLSVTGGDPYLIRGGMRVEAGSVKQVVIRMKADAGEQAQFFWATDSSLAIDEPKSLHFAILPDGEFHDYRVPVGGHPMWKGTITQLRLDPNQNQAGSRVEVDFIRSE